jgi:hypothetical protein
MPGARGRLIANIVYKLANNESTPIVFTKHNSAHTFIDDWDMHYVSDVDNIQTNSNKKAVFFTHLYPKWDTSTIGTIFINVKRDYLTEVCLNAVIKNVIAKIEFLRDGGSLDDTEKNFMKVYDKFLPNNYIDILSDNNKLKEFFNSIKTSFVPMVDSHYSNFINNISKDNDIFHIDYNNIFELENGKYVVLNQLTSWMNVDYTNDIHTIFEQYDLDKYKIFEKYCPWLKEEIKW